MSPRGDAPSVGRIADRCERAAPVAQAPVRTRRPGRAVGRLSTSCPLPLPPSSRSTIYGLIFLYKWGSDKGLDYPVDPDYASRGIFFAKQCVAKEGLGDGEIEERAASRARGWRGVAAGGRAHTL